MWISAFWGCWCYHGNVDTGGEERSSQSSRVNQIPYKSQKLWKNRLIFSVLNINLWKVSVTLSNTFGALLPGTNSSYLWITHCKLHTVTFLNFLNIVIKGWLVNLTSAWNVKVFLLSLVYIFFSIIFHSHGLVKHIKREWFVSDDAN